VKFGKRAGKIEQTQSNASGDWPKNLRDGDTRVRFVEEIEDWIEYWEHFDDQAKFFPCTEDRATCPGCTSDSEKTRKASKRYLATVLDPRTGRVYALKLPMDLANRLSLRNDRNGGTITNRDYTLIRSGKGLDTEYDVEQEEKVAIDLSVYQDVIDPQEMLGSQFAAAWPDFDPDRGVSTRRGNGGRRARDEEDEPRRTRRAESPTIASMRRGVAPASPEVEGGEPPFEQPDVPAAEPEPEPTPPPTPRRRRAPARAQAEPQPEPAPDEDVIEISEDDLRNMPRTELINLARQAQVEVTLTMSRDQIIDILLTNFSS